MTACLKKIAPYLACGISFWIWRAGRRNSRLARRESLSDAPERATSSGFEVELEQVEAVVRIYRFVEQLPWDQQHVVRSRFAEEKSIREIARELSRSEGAVKQLQFRALKTLRARLSE